MPREITFNPDVQHQIEGLGQTEIVVGLYVQNHSNNLDQVLRSIRFGLDQYFPQEKSVVVVSDGGSSHEMTMPSLEAIPRDRLICFSHKQQPIHRINMPYHGLASRAACLHSILGITGTLNAKACLLIDPDNQGIIPEWVNLMLKPVLEDGFDFVAPSYQRHKYDGTLTNSVIYPLTRTLYGQRIRHPIGQDLAFSQSMVAGLVKKDDWHNPIVSSCTGLWMTTIAVAEGFRVCQSLLGARVQSSRSVGTDLSLMLTQVVGSIFDLMGTYQTVWVGVRGSEPSPIFGIPQDVGVEPVKVNIDRMVGAFNQGVADLACIWEEFLSLDVLAGLKDLASASLANFRFSDGLWVKTVFEFAAAYSKTRMDRTHLIKSMTPLYLGRTASFVLETLHSTAAEVENRIELLCLEFENQKPYLVECWRK